MSTHPSHPPLADLPRETEYRSDTHELVRDFYLPYRERSTEYHRAVGYFTSRRLSIATQDMTALIERGCHMLLVGRPLFLCKGKAHEGHGRRRLASQ